MATRAKEAMFLLGFTACASTGSAGQDERVLVRGASDLEIRSAAVEVLETAGFTVDHRSSAEIVGSTGSGLAPNGYQEWLSCGRGSGDVAAGMIFHGPGVDRPTGRFVVRIAPSDEGTRLAMAADFEARACTVEHGRRTCEVVTCESTGLLERQIVARIDDVAESTAMNLAGR